jgi:cell division cycle 2-like
MKARPEYSTPVDVWSMGCIMAELLSGEALLPGRSELAQISLIFNTLGSPTQDSWPGFWQMPAIKKNKLVGDGGRGDDMHAGWTY